MEKGRLKPNPEPSVNACDQTARRIVDFLEENRDEMIQMLHSLVHLESPSGNQQALAAILAQLGDTISSLGFRVKVFKPPSGVKAPQQLVAGHLLARPTQYKHGGGFQLLLGHCDTVWPIHTLETMPLTQVGFKLKGPGVFDMKAGLVQMIFALKTLRELEMVPDLTPVILINSDEEIGSRNSTRLIQRLAAMVERVFVLEPALGEAGHLKTTRKGGASYEVVVVGKAAHAGLNPQAGASAILELSYLVQKLFALNDLEKGISVNVGKIEGGVQSNVIAPESRALVEVRTIRLADLQRIENAIFQIKPQTPGVTWHISRRGFRPPMETTDRNRQLWELAKKQGSRLGLTLEDAMAGGGSDGNTTSAFTATLDGLGAVGDGAHAAHEFIDLKRLVERTALLALLLLAPPSGIA